METSLALTISTSLVSLVGFLICRSVHAVASKPREVKDYCEGESFEARCAYNEVIVMLKANYGRMRLDRCVKLNMGYIGCQADVLDLVDTMCSGRRNCKLHIPDMALETTQPCMELKSYLEASYDCIDVLTVESNDCRNSRFLRTHQASGRIASVTVQETWCGTRDTPWLIQGSSGQRVNITLLDFNAHRREPITGAGASKSPSLIIPTHDPSLDANSCHKYATIVEPGPVEKSVLVCGRRSRAQQIYVSDGHVVQVQMEARRIDPDYFLINYEVFGCADPVVSITSWFERSENKATVGCKQSSDKWTLVCDGNKWTGDSIVGNCTDFLISSGGEVVGRSSLEEKSPNSAMLAVVCVMVFLITMFAVLLTVFLYKRYHQSHIPSMDYPPASIKSKTGSSTYGEEELSYMRPSRSLRYGHHHQHPRSDSPVSRGTSDYSANYEKVGGCKQGEKYTHIWEMPLPIPGE